MMTPGFDFIALQLVILIALTVQHHAAARRRRVPHPGWAYALAAATLGRAWSSDDVDWMWWLSLVQIPIWLQLGYLWGKIRRSDES
jgi:hypothetical protein